ncbi:MT-A70 family methyltransferase [Ancylobacter mangrovi]|uniref:MT-A70 family methyltransferase n=1 Tax=Ancylobacter mangrovi TaxID=2972472 RepID=UPI0021621C64|nr:MT-A70 family methyltransferase [Ancylobacter mangrovi]MCS0501398.1 MT-A70 family methyltransferase [Ancylobacter mangrovi]
MDGWFFDPLPLFGFDLVEIDPAWNFDLYSAKGAAKSAQAQYATMSLADITAMPVGNLLAPGGVCIMWTTWPLVAAGAHVEVIRGWGLLPVTGGGWAKRTASGKLRWGTGYVARSLHEPYIIARLPGAKWAGAGFPNLVETLEADSLDGLAREHSRKPDEFYSRCEAAWPEARRVSVFSRQTREGWASWGNEATKFDRAGVVA